MNKCTACGEDAVTFIKGLWLCGGHLVEATERVRAGDGKAIMATGSNIMATLTRENLGLQRVIGSE